MTLDQEADRELLLHIVYSLPMQGPFSKVAPAVGALQKLCCKIKAAKVEKPIEKEVENGD